MFPLNKILIDVFEIRSVPAFCGAFSLLEFRLCRSPPFFTYRPSPLSVPSLAGVLKRLLKKTHKQILAIIMKTRCFPASGAILMAMLLSGGVNISTAQQIDKVKLRIEQSDSLNGPWEGVDLGNQEKDADGNPLFPVDGAGFFRARIENHNGIPSGPGVVPLAEVPELYLELAKSFMKSFLPEAQADGGDSDEGAWPEDVEFAPYVRQVGEVSGGGSITPAYLEFKVVRVPVPASAKTDWVSPAWEGEDSGQGYLMVSLNEDDFPIAEFATTGPTACEQLLMQAKGRAIRVVRYGSTFSVAEDKEGNPVATQGAAPFRVDPRFLELDGFEWRGDDETGLDTSPKKIPELTAQGYASYAEFKKSVETDPTIAAYRKIRKARARTEWDALRGRGNRPLKIIIGESEIAFPTSFGRVGGDYLLVTDTPRFITVERSPVGGLKLTALTEGEGLLRVRGSDGIEQSLFVSAIPKIGRRSSYSQITKTFYAGNWAIQPKYHQTENSNWCPRVGCGPTAWAMLFAWFDRNWGVEWAFRGEPAGQQPPIDTSNSSRRSAVFQAYNELHELCDVICFGAFSDQGASWPTDMTEGMKAYTYVYALPKYINRSWTTNTTTGTWPEAGALRSRDAIKKGYPAVTGLGWMWHYVLAYGYSYTTTTIDGHSFTSRYLKCNMGWGKNISPRWYNMLDTFYSADVKITKGPNAP